jgi:hypothetical protein
VAGLLGIGALAGGVAAAATSAGATTGSTSSGSSSTSSTSTGASSSIPARAANLPLSGTVTAVGSSSVSKDMPSSTSLTGTTGA